MAERLRAVAVLDGPNTTDAAAADFRALFGSRRAYIVDPHFEVWAPEAGATAAEPPTARVAGVIAATDARRGFWTSPSNRTIHGISGTSRPVDFALDDPTSRANALNAGEVATVIRDAGGFRLRGNRTCAADAMWAFLPVARTADLIADSILRVRSPPPPHPGHRPDGRPGSGKRSAATSAGCGGRLSELRREQLSAAGSSETFEREIRTVGGHGRGEEHGLEIGDATLVRLPDRADTPPTGGAGRVHLRD